MSAEQPRSPYLHLPSGSGRQSVSPKIGSGRVKSPLPAPAAYRASCMSAAAKRYKVTNTTTNINMENSENALTWLDLILY